METIIAAVTGNRVMAQLERAKAAGFRVLYMTPRVGLTEEPVEVPANINHVLWTELRAGAHHAAEILADGFGDVHIYGPDGYRAIAMIYVMTQEHLYHAHQITGRGIGRLCKLKAIIDRGPYKWTHAEWAMAEKSRGTPMSQLLQGAQMRTESEDGWQEWVFPDGSIVLHHDGPITEEEAP